MDTVTANSVNSANSATSANEALPDPAARCGPHRNARKPYWLLAALPVLGLAVAAVVFSLPASPPSALADVHGRARDYATVEAAHEAAMDAIARTEAFVRRHRRWPASLAETGYTFAGSFAVAAIEIPAGSNAAITVRFKEPYAGYRIEYVRLAGLNADDGDWVCATGGIPEHAVPADCEASAIDRSEVAVRAPRSHPIRIYPSKE